MAAGDVSAAMTYQIGSSTIRIHVGHLTRSRSHALVSSAGYLLSMGGGVSSMGGGVSAAILNAGGQAIWSDARKMAPRAAGDIVVTGAGSLPARYVLHAIMIGPGGEAEQLPPGAVVRQATQRVMPTTACLLTL